MLSTVDYINFSNKQVIVRLDLNVPLKNGKIIDNTRIKRVIPTLKKILADRPRYIVILSHLGRPKPKSPEEFNENDSLLPVAAELQSLLEKEVIFSKQPIGKKLKEILESSPNSSVIMAENIRFYEGEEKNDPEFSKTIASLGNIFVNDAFSCSHRAHSSVVGVTNYLQSFAGLSLESEVAALAQCLDNPKRPVVGILGGSKVSTKIDLLLNLLNKLDYLFLGGGIANTILCAMGYKLGASLVENERLGVAETIIQKAKNSRCKLILPTDAVVANKLSPNIDTQVVEIGKIALDQSIYDIGPQTIENLIKILRECKTVLWNGPVGLYEVPPFANGSIAIAKEITAITQSRAITSIAGGGDTIAVIAMAQEQNSPTHFSYLSTAGGAFLEYLEGKELPGIEALKCNLKMCSNH